MHAHFTIDTLNYVCLQAIYVRTHVYVPTYGMDRRKWRKYNYILSRNY